MPPAAKHLCLSGALLALVLAAFAGGWHMGWRTGRGSSLDPDGAARLARLEDRLGELEKASRAPGGRPPAAGAPGPGPVPSGGGAAARAEVYAVDIGDSPVTGPADAPVTIVAFSDFECPFCASAHPTLERVMAEYEGKVRLVFKHNPLPAHRHALLAHRAAVAAHRQGRFWEMHDRLFASQDRLDRESLRSHAEALRLDVKAFEELLASPESTQVVSADMSQAGRLGLQGVPAFFVNGRFVPGAQPFQVFKELIDEELRPRG